MRCVSSYLWNNSSEWQVWALLDQVRVDSVLRRGFCLCYLYEANKLALNIGDIFYLHALKPPLCPSYRPVICAFYSSILLPKLTILCIVLCFWLNISENWLGYFSMEFYLYFIIIALYLNNDRWTASFSCSFKALKSQ